MNNYIILGKKLEERIDDENITITHTYKHIDAYKIQSTYSTKELTEKLKGYHIHEEKTYTTPQKAHYSATNKQQDKTTNTSKKPQYPPDKHA